MDLTRRDVAVGTGAVVLAGAPGPARSAGGKTAMYGLIGRMIAAPGRRTELAEILLGGTAHMPGCLSYIVAADATHADALWITEVWDSKASHDASLQLPAVQAAITKGRPLIAGMDSQAETVPMGGAGLGRG